MQILTGMNNRKIYFSNFLCIILFFSPLGIGTTVEVSIDVKSCKNVQSIERVVANISYSFHRRGDVKITIISPSETPSELLSFRDKDATNKGLFLIMHL
jgi:subtilisin-like proprotein convertase family protein